MTTATTIEMTDISALVPALNVRGTPALVAEAHCSPAEFLGAVEALRERGVEVKLGWRYGSEEIQATYEDGGVRVILAGPDLADEPRALPNAEERLRELAG